LNPAQGHALSGDDFKAGHIIDDDVFRNASTMSPQEIQNFLVKKDSTCLKDFKTQTLHDSDGDGNGDEPYGKGNQNKARASKVIWQASQIYDINPQVFLITLQKEQGLLTRDDCPDWRYQTALGFGCPDDEPCDSSAYGFTRQLDYGGWHFRGYFEDSLAYVPYSPGKNSVDYHPRDSCGSSQVNIRNRATAALYSYTPYQPNQAALNNLDGTGDSCSAYGNRNFWRDFNRFFKDPAPGNQILLLRDQETGRIYLIRGHKRIHVASLDAYQAWGFDDLPVTGVTRDTINQYTPATYKLNRFALMAGTNKRFFVDGQNGYRMNEKSAATWQFNMDKMPAVPKAAIHYLENRQKLPYIVNSPVSHKKYMMDGGRLRHYPSPNIMNAWEPNTRSATISERFFCKGNTSGNDCDIRWGIGNRLGYPKASTANTNKIFFINQGNKHWISSGSMHKVYSGDHSGVSQATMNRFFDAPEASALLSRNYSPHKYLLDEGTKRYIPNPRLLDHWEPGGNGKVTNVSQAFMNLLEDGEPIDAYTAQSQNRTTPSGETVTYYINQSKYRLGGVETTDSVQLGQSTASLYQDKELDTPFVTSEQTDKIFFLSGNGKHHVSSVFNLRNMREGSGLGIMNLPHSLLEGIHTGKRASFQFKVGKDYYVFDNGGYRHVAGPTTNQRWGLNPQLELDVNSLEWFNKKPSLRSEFRLDDKVGIAREGTLYTSKKTRVGALWGASSDSHSISPRLASQFEQKSLTPFVTTPESLHYYLYDGQKLSKIPNLATLRNLGWKRFNGATVFSRDQIDTMEATDNSATYLLSKSDGVIDDGKRRQFPVDGETADAWFGSETQLYTQKLVDLFAQKTADKKVSRLITSPETNKYYCMYDGKKRWLTGPSSKDNSECSDNSLRGVSHKLLKQIPTGDNI
jgi:hypothetical protein